MNDELYNQLKQLEDNLYDLIFDNNLIDTKVGDAWSLLFTFIQEQRQFLQN